MSSVRYPVVLLDLDHTLLDSDESERLAYAHTMDSIGFGDGAAHFDRYVEINRRMWRAVEAGELLPGEVRHRRFEAFNEEIGLDADPSAMADAFVEGLATSGELYSGAMDVLEQLAEMCSLAMITNGLTYVQRTRVERLGIGRFFDAVIISESVGVTKPRPEIFELAFERLGNPDRAGAVMVGDSLTSDIAGGRNADIATCWYDPGRVGAPAGVDITHVVHDLVEVTEVAAGTRE